MKIIGTDAYALEQRRAAYAELDAERDEALTDLAMQRPAKWDAYLEKRAAVKRAWPVQRDNPDATSP